MKKMPEVSRMESLFDYTFNIDYQPKLDYKTNYGFIRSLCTKNLVDDVKNYISSVNNFKNFVQIGIGGSALGATSSIEFLNGIYFNYTKDKKYFVLDNIDPQRLKFVLSLNPHETLFHIVSKSGSTTETIVQFAIIYESLKKTLKDNIHNHFVFTTSQHGFLYEFAKEHNIKTFFIPDDTGGRFSVFTSVGLIPIAFFGNDIETFIEGAKTAVRSYRNGWNFPNDFTKFTLGEYKKGKNILVMFAYKDSLYGIVDWFRQLWAESLGKQEKGQTVIKALGTTDQHSQLQLYSDGKKDKVIIFLDTVADSDFIVDEIKGFSYLKNKKVTEIMSTQKKATFKALTEKNVPCGDVFLKEKNEFSLGALYMSLMIATAKAGEILEIDPFNQPGVEKAKQYTKQLLTEKKDV